ncbi:C-X-C motif chemokine 11-1 [Salmo salar]|uniref:C-X-C motif chemokine 11-1 n=1 Tax=Salmo salar TaxID=8030 RepID=A0ABM3EM89_SALSA|nr:C-X-C motif chemokine 11-1-like [Salmo salar]
MTMITRILLLLAVTICVTAAQRSVSQRCLCRKVRDSFGAPNTVEDIQIIPPTPSCDRLEFIVSLKNGVQYCLDPSMKVQRLLTRLMKKSSPPTLPTPIEAIPNERSTDPADI